MIIDPDTATMPAGQVARPLVTFKADGARYAGFPNYIFGLHDPDGEAHMLAAGRPGWVVVTVQLNPPDTSGDFSTLAEKGIGVIVRLNNGYFSAGTIPNSTQYDRFALRCAQFVGASKGAHIWVIGNAPNTALERPGNDGTDNSGEVITPEMYARCFIASRRAIRALPGHENDWVIPAAIAPFSTQTNYPKNPSGDWVRYFADVLFQISAQRGGLDGLALHTYTHGGDATLVMSDATAGGHFPTRHWHFRAYRDFLAAVPPPLRNLPVFVTEAQPLEPGWTSQNRNWIQTACDEINSWNSNAANQAIQALCFFRWQARAGDPGSWGMSDKQEVIQDFAAALQNEYRVRWHGIQPKPNYRAEWIGTPGVPENGLATNEVIAGQVVVKNTGAKAWASTGNNAVQLGCRWFDLKGAQSPPRPDARLFGLGRIILPGQTAIIDRVELHAPWQPGTYILKFDLVREGDVWFSAFDSPTKDLTIAVTAPAYAVEWQLVVPVSENTIETNTNIVGRVQARNIGSSTWLKGGASPVRLGYRWYDSQGAAVSVVPSPSDFELDADTPPGATATFEDVTLRSPDEEGTFSLVWDLVEGGVWFGEEGAETNRQVVTVARPLPDLAAKWTSVFEIPKMLEPNETVNGSISVQNTGLQVWNAGGENPVRLSIQWFDQLGNQVPGAAKAGDISLREDVPPGGFATFEQVQVRSPIPRGKHTLVFDLTKEGVTFFSATGSRPYHLPIEVKTDALDYFAEWLETVAVPENTLISGETIRGRVVVRNAGALVWNSGGENPASLSYRWCDAAGEEAAATPDKYALNQDLPPRESAVFDDVLVRAPELSGEYILEFDLLREGIGWFEHEGSPPASIPIRVKSPPLDWGAEFVAHNAPPNLVVGQETLVDLQIKNIGKNIWRKDGAHSVYAVYKWINSAGEPQTDTPDHRTALVRDISPGESASLNARLAAPLTSGAYHLHWDLVAEGVSSFAEGGNPELVLPGNVTTAPTQTNLWRAEASHNAASAILAIDGDLNSFWSSQSIQTPGMWFRLNLGTPRVINGIAFRSPGNAYPSGYNLRISCDGQSWRTVWGVPHRNARDVFACFAPAEVLYGQLDLVVPSDEMWAIGEVQIHPSPLWNATASLNSDAAPNAIDNDPATSWTTDQSQTPDMWFQLDLGRIETVSGLRLVPPRDEFPSGFRVSVWNQQVGGWQKIVERQNNREAIDISFAPVRTEYVNVHLLQEANRPWAIREASVTMAMNDWVGPSNG